MRTALRRIGFALFLLLSVFFLWLGSVYATVNEPLWFHAAAVPEEVREAVRPLYFALMNLIGGSSFGLGLLALFATATAISKGSRAAALAVATAFTIALGMAAITAEDLARETGAPTSWRIMGALLAINITALLAALAGGKLRQTPDQRTLFLDEFD